MDWRHYLAVIQRKPGALRNGAPFIENAENVVFISGPGTGKSHVATAIGVQAIEHHRHKVRFYSTVELVNALEQEKAIGKTGKMATALLDRLTHRCTSWKLETTATASKSALRPQRKHKRRSQH